MNGENPNADLACHQVFNIDELREQILTYVIQKDGGSQEDTCSLRLVQKAWMADVSRIMKKLRKPLYKLQLNRDNSLNGCSYVQEHGTKILNNFISTVVLSPQRIENVIPPFSLSLDLAFFKNENRQGFSNFLTGDSVAGLVELKMSIPASGGSFDYLFGMPPFPSFPILRELSVKFCERWAVEVDDDDSDSSSVSTFLPFLQSVLVGASQLKTMEFPPNHAMADIIPAGIKDLTLPRSLTQLKLSGVLTNAQLEGLATNSLPNLTHLSLPIYCIVISNDLLYQILDQYKKTLRGLIFHGHPAALLIEQPKPTSHIRFPVMESLQTLVTESVTAELESEHHYELQALLPVLKSVQLKEQSVNMLRKWTDNSCLETVTQLTVNLVNDDFLNGSSYEVTIHLEEMQALHMAFPNVNVLDVRVVGTQTCGLKYVFMEMKQLTQLTVRVEKAYKIENSVHWDSLLTGIPNHMAKTIGTNPQFWECINSIDFKVEESSLKNLKALGSLRLIAPLPHPYGHFINRRLIDGSLISDTVFHLACLKMPNLKILSLEGEFRASPGMTQVWEAEQRSISYSPTISDY